MRDKNPARHLTFWRWGVLVSTAIALALGCSKSNDKRFDAALKESGLPSPKVSPLAGTVTIDGRPPEGAGAVFAVLNDVSKPDEPLDRRLDARCEKDGHFEFSSFSRGDGAPEGNYVITFVRLKKSGRIYVRPDLLNNLYSDPEKNAQHAEFKIEHKDPGKTDYVFELKVAGEQPAQPGKYSLQSTDE